MSELSSFIANTSLQQVVSQARLPELSDPCRMSTRYILALFSYSLLILSPTTAQLLFSSYIQACSLSSPSLPKKGKKSHYWTLPTASPHLFPESNWRDRGREKRGGGASEMKCVLKMAGLPLTAELHSHVC